MIDSRAWGWGLVDTHVHLADIMCEVNLDPVLEKSRALGIIYLFNMGTCADDWAAVMEISAKYTCTLPFIGLHPWYADRLQNHMQQLQAFWESGNVGIGEIGLDRLRGPDADTQITCFRWQLEEGLRLNRPVSIHCVRMWGKMVEILSEYAPLNRRVAIHAYGGSADTAAQLVEMGVMVSLCGTVLSDDRHRLHTAVRRIPDRFLLLETDAPALIPRGDMAHESLLFADGRLYNHPANLQLIAQHVAQMRETTLADLTAFTVRNSYEFYTGAMDE